ncbi:MAG: hypothetical protein P8Z30_07235 [Acidobacteriota bacterium]
MHWYSFGFAQGLWTVILQLVALACSTGAGVTPLTNGILQINGLGAELGEIISVLCDLS